MVTIFLAHIEISKGLAYNVAVLALFVADYTWFSLISKTKLVHDTLELTLPFTNHRRVEGRLAVSQTREV